MPSWIRNILSTINKQKTPSGAATPNGNTSNLSNHQKREYDAIEYSNRPFIDERTEEEKKKYIDNLQKQKNPYDYSLAKEHYLERQARLKEYRLILTHLPNIAPKSYSGYARMKTMNTKNYQSLVTKMKDKGFDIE